MRALSLVAVLLGAVCSGAPLAVRAAPLEQSRLWGWLLAAFSDDFTGRFDHCGILQQWPNGRSLGFAINPSGWSMAIEDRRWHLPVGQRYAIGYSIDNGPVIGTQAEAVGRRLIQIALPPSSALFEQMKTGQWVHVEWGVAGVQFPLTMSASALPALLACLQRYAPGASPFADRR